MKIEAMQEDFLIYHHCRDENKRVIDGAI